MLFNILRPEEMAALYQTPFILWIKESLNLE